MKEGICKMQQLVINNASIRDDNYTPPVQSADTLFHFVRAGCEVSGTQKMR